MLVGRRYLDCKTLDFYSGVISSIIYDFWILHTINAEYLQSHRLILIQMRQRQENRQTNDE